MPFQNYTETSYGLVTLPPCIFQLISLISLACIHLQYLISRCLLESSKSPNTIFLSSVHSRVYESMTWASLYNFLSLPSLSSIYKHSKVVVFIVETANFASFLAILYLFSIRSLLLILTSYQLYRCHFFYFHFPFNISISSPITLMPTKVTSGDSQHIFSCYPNATSSPIPQTIHLMQLVVLSRRLFTSSALPHYQVPTTSSSSPWHLP